MEPKTIVQDGSEFWWPEEILIEIICRLSDKPLHRFKCVSKGWAYLISCVCIPRITSLCPLRPLAGLYIVESKFTPEDDLVLSTNTQDYVSMYFTDDWLRGYRINIPLVRQYVSLEEDDDEEEEEDRSLVVDSAIHFGSLPFTPNFNDLLDCCNGLLLFFDTVSSFKFYVYNPLTKQSISIPISIPLPEPYARWQTEDPCVHASIVFDPSKSLNYRIVRFERVDRYEFRRIERVFLDIYHSTSRNWSRHLVKNLHYALHDSWTRHAVYFNGSLYRLAISWRVVEFRIGDKETSSGDEISASFIDLPIGVAQTHNVNMIGCIGVHLGRLCYANHWEHFVYIWSLMPKNHYATRWVLIRKIDLSFVYRWVVLFRARHCPPCAEWLGPIAFHPYSEVIYLSSPLVMIGYNYAKQTMEMLKRVKEDNDVILPGSYVPALPYVRLLNPFDEDGNIEACHEHRPVPEA